MPPKLPPHVKRVRNRVGAEFFYLHRFRGTAREEKPVRLPHISDPQFWSEYARLQNLPQPKAATDTFDVLIAEWQASTEWGELSAKTQKLWRGSCKHISAAWGSLQVRGIEPRNVLKLRDTMANRPGAANNMLRCLGSMLVWSVPRGWRTDNPVRDVKKLKGGDGYERWPWEAIEAAKSMPQVDLWWCVALALYTGQRLSDVLAMRWNAMNPAGLIAVKQGKTGKDLLIPVHRELAAVIDVIPRRAVTILTQPDGMPWTMDKFQKAWRKHRPALVAEHGLVFHGLRKSAVCCLLEAGCSDAEVGAITGQSRATIEHYARMVNQEKLAKAAILRWENGAAT